MFNSVLATEMTSFMELRKATVNPQSITTEVTAISTLDRCLVDHSYHEKCLSEEILDTWVLTLHGKSKTVKEKVILIRNFVKYLNAMGNQSFLPNAPKAKSDYIPYIYSDDEILSIFHYADNLKTKSTKGCSPYLLIKIPMILRILYGCGTRLGETMALQRKDIDFKARTIFLRKTKSAKERLIPVHEILISILEKYCLTLGIMPSPDAYLFPGQSPERPFTNRQVQTWFSEILRRANIDQRERTRYERRACLHCLRHLFVLKSMRQLEAAGHPVDLNDLRLPTYLGHECLLDTDQYMKFSGAQIPESLDAFETFTAGIIPRVEAPYEEE